MLELPPAERRGRRHPSKGTIYFVKNGDIRSKVRQGLFPAAVGELKKLGVAAEILEGTRAAEPKRRARRGDGHGRLRLEGLRQHHPARRHLRHFTSFGGVMSQGAGQTPLSEFLRYGAAGASGTVTEPYAIAEKFPSPMIQVHYARGCTLAEAFYQSVSRPVPVADRGRSALPALGGDSAGVGRRGQARGRGARQADARTLAPRCPAAPRPITSSCSSTASAGPSASRAERLPLDTANLADGYHELRVVAVGPPPIESQGRQIIPVRLANHGRKIEASLADPAAARAPTSRVTIAVRSPGSIGIVVIHGSRVVGRVAGEEGQIEIPANTLGAGPVRLRVVGLGSGGTAERNVVGRSRSNSRCNRTSKPPSAIDA